MRKVVYLDHTASLSGGELALLRVLPHVDGDPHVIVAEDGPLVAKLREAGATVEVLPLDRRAARMSRDRVTPRGIHPCVVWQFWLYILSLRRRLHELRPDLVHTNSLKSALYGGAAARLAGLPVVWHIRDRVAPDYLPKSAVTLVRILSRVIPTAIVANSRATLGTLQLAGGFRLSVVEGSVIPSPASTEVAYKERRSRQPGPVTIGMIGRLAPWKGQDVFLRAFAEAFAETSVRGRVVGSALFGEHRYAEALVELVEQLGISSQMTLVGFKENVSEEYERLDILVHASVLPEPFGQVIIEGMAAGVAVIASACGGPLELITPGVDGLLVQPGDVRALAEAMKVLVEDPSLRHRLQDQGPFSAAPYRPAVIGQAISELHASVLAHLKTSVLSRLANWRN